MILHVVSGLVAWSLAEYGTHRFPMHARRGSSPLANEHLDHHGHPEQTVELGLDLNTIGLRGGAGLLAGVLVSPGFGVGFAAGYVGYTHLHHQIHHRQPRTAMGERLWSHHLEHHVGAPARNFGVTSPAWDLVFGTRS